MQIGMRQVSVGTVEWLKSACASGELTRSALARGLCEQEGWYGASGKPIVSSARVLLPKLADQLSLRLPEAESVDFEPHVPPALDFPEIRVASTLRDNGIDLRGMCY